jgi:ABC-type transporter lipoprotein component MlaA
MYIPPPSNTLRSMPDQLEKYDAATQEAVDPYLSARTAYIQQRDEAAKK